MKTYKTNSTRNKHNSEVYTCNYPECNKIFSTKFSWKRHQIIHNPKRNFICQCCGKKFALAQQLKEHFYIHTKEFPHVCGIDGCKREFKHASELSLHKRTHPGFQAKKYRYLSLKTSSSNSEQLTAKFLIVSSKSKDKTQKFVKAYKNSKNSVNSKANIECLTKQSVQSGNAKNQRFDESINGASVIDFNYLNYLMALPDAQGMRDVPLLPFPEVKIQ